jgi:serine/threonine protein kinase
VRVLPKCVFGVDWWTFGTLIFEMVIGKTPFSARGFDDLKEKIASDEAVFPPANGQWAEDAFTAEIKDIISSLLIKDESKRLGSRDDQEVQQHAVRGSSLPPRSSAPRTSCAPAAAAAAA